MALNWLKLREPAPGKLEEAREQAHWAAQAVTKAARANLPAKDDDSQSALVWENGALMTAPMARQIKVGLDVAKLEYIFVHDSTAERGPTAEWLDGRLAAAGLKPGAGVKLPYEVARKSGKDANLPSLARWFAASAEVLEQVRAKHATVASPVYLWPHHFDIATLLSYPGGRSIGAGVSMGDHYYAQPYLYVSVYPAPKDAIPPPLPAGHWHTKEFFGAVATGDELLAGGDPRRALEQTIDAALQAGKEWLDV